YLIDMEIDNEEMSFDSLGSQLSQKSTKTIYAKLFKLSKKTFIYDAQNKMNNQEIETETFFNINNPAIIKHKGRPSKKLKSNAKKSVSKQEKQVLSNSTNVIEKETNETNSTMG
ncbi:14369_t:CDS:2, partial [Funneliformis mosseae]